MADTCPICLDVLGEYGDPFESLLTILECGATLEPPTTVCHTFHRACLNGWRQANPDHKQNCPTCRRRLTDEEVATVREAHAAKNAPAPPVAIARPSYRCRQCLLYSTFAAFACFFVLVAGGVFTENARKV
jgi:ferric-dicitrate binding protein FerR (iron transport regulator)